MDQFRYLGNALYPVLYLDGKLMDALRSDHTSRYLPHEIHPMGRMETLEE